MTVLWIILIIAAVIAAAVLFAWVTFEINFEKNELNKNAEVFVRYLFIRKRIYPRPVKKKIKEKPEKSQSGEKDINYIEYIKKAAENFELLKADFTELMEFCAVKMIKVKELEFEYLFGLEDPMYTGMANGLIYGVVYNILGIVHNNMRIERCRINIVPDFDKECHNIRFHCILHLKNVHIIVMIIKVVKMYSRLKKSVKSG